jgi:DNA-binding HxlR family transcriptional regulator
MAGPPQSREGSLFAGVTRFSDFLRRLGLARNILAARLDGFVEAGIMERFSPEGSSYQEYRLADKGRDLAPVVVALTDWGDRWAAPNGRPIIYRHVDCGGELEQQLVCSQCHTLIDHDEVGVESGPGMSSRTTRQARDVGHLGAIACGS